MALRSLIGRLTSSSLAQRGWRAVLCALLVAVLWLALTPDSQPVTGTGWDKANHLLAFVALAIAGRFGFPGRASRSLMLAGALLAFGGLIEVLQASVPGRSAEWADVLADLAGIATGTLIAAMALRSARS
ncbi:VanZ family protein [Piscinibacter sp. XHJ-5]|uniref:VanZ family protein n=1 Tax=Piscinibacter sp. XHJ-5 TaxID=3037797 RepID=UPI00245316FC|nr:VanZ family protein [Piscinibacter sp. XHJ-5]